jgi:hypothetical protein
VLLGVGTAMMLGGLIVVANPDSGLGYDTASQTYLPRDPNYQNAIQALRSKCAIVVGYVHDCYGNTNPPTASNCPRSTDITADIDRWFSIYDIDGIFIDQVLDTDLSRAASLVAAVRSHRNDAVVVLNPGRLPSIDFMRTTDPAIVVIQEQAFAQYGSWPPDGWVRDRATGAASIADGRLAIIAHTHSKPTRTLTN